jgi:hypothetical protein
MSTHFKFYQTQSVAEYDSIMVLVGHHAKGNTNAIQQPAIEIVDMEAVHVHYQLFHPLRTWKEYTPFLIYILTTLPT